MGLSTKQVSSGWNQSLLQASNLELPNNPMKRQSSSQQQQQGDQQLKCPRCESTNTKFCYYNNYNKSQPRHFCKACKRHWTKGGTLRNVPIGGGRKNKRKSSETTMRIATKTSYSTSKVASNNTMTIQGQQPKLNMKITSPRVVDDDNEKFNKGFNESKDGVYVGPQDLHYQYSNLDNFESLSSTISSLQSPNTQVYSSLEETMMNNNMLISSSWSMGVSPTSNNNWGWDSFDKFASVDADLISIPWDDLEIKP